MPGPINGDVYTVVNPNAENKTEGKVNFAWSIAKYLSLVQIQYTASNR